MATNQSDPVARVYAVALYESALERGTVGEVQQGLSVVNAVWEDRVFRDFFTSPRVPRAVKIKGIDAALSGKIGPQVLNFLKVLIAKGREPQFDNIVGAFNVYRDQAENRIHAWVQSGSEFKDAEVEAIKRQLSTASGGKEVVLHYEHKPELLGGAKIRLGDTLIDNTLRTRLNHLAQSVHA